jgi:hypothetical protein
MLTDSISFALVSALTTPKNGLPTFKRSTTAALPFTVAGSLRFITAGVHRPRFGADGVLALEKASTNLISFPTRLNDSSWIKGSSVFVTADIVPGMDNNYLADRVTVSQFTGNANAQLLRKTISFGAGRTFTATVYLALAAGKFGANDVIRVSGAGLLAPASVALGPIYNDSIGNYVAASFTFTTAGTAPTPATETTADPGVPINFELYCESSVSLNWAGCQIEEGSYATSYIPQEGQVRSRDRDWVQYPQSPASGLSEFVFYTNLVRWAGDGLIVQAGDFIVEIVGGKLRARCGAIVANDPTNLPDSAQIAVRVSRGLQRVQVYVNRVMVVSQSLTNYVAAAGRLDLGGNCVRWLKNLYFFNAALSDGSIGVGQTVLGDLLELHTQDSLIVAFDNAHSEQELPPVRIPAGGEVAVRFPNYRSATQDITAVTPGVGAQAQVWTVTVDSAAINQIDEVVINGISIRRTATTATAADQASALATAINAQNAAGAIPVTANWLSGATFTVTANRAGNDFALSANGKLSQQLTTPNRAGNHTLTVPSALDYQIGAAVVYRDYAYLCDIAITAINTGSNTITFTSIPDQNIDLIFQGDQLVQVDWQLEIAPNNYACFHREDFPDVRPSGKSHSGFRMRNSGTTERRITPYVVTTL